MQRSFRNTLALMLASGAAAAATHPTAAGAQAGPKVATRDVVIEVEQRPELDRPPARDADAPTTPAPPDGDGPTPTDGDQPPTDGAPPTDGNAPAPTDTPTRVEPRETNARGGIHGRVVDADTGEPLSDVTVTVDGDATSATTGRDGEFDLDLKPGTYTLRLSSDLYRRHRIRDVVVRRGTTKLDVRLSPEEIEEVVVVAPPDTASDAVQVVRRRKRATVSDAISSEQISRSPDSSASDAAKRMVGATIQDGKYVVIRGLGGRYSLTLLNGVPLPSPDPDVPAAPLDLFPAALLANLTVTKTFSPDMPASFAGGALSIETRSFPSKFTLKVRSGIAADSETSLQALNEYEGGSLDVLGFDDGTRALPSAIPEDELAAGLDLTPDQIRDQMVSFGDTWAVDEGTASPNGSFGMTVGNTHDLSSGRGKQRLGYFGSANYGRGFSSRRSHIQAVGEDDGMGGLLPSTLQLDEDLGRNSAALNGLITAGWTHGSSHQVNLIGLYTHTAEDSASITTGIDGNTSVVERRRLQFVERQMIFGQLMGESAVAGGDVVIGWQTNLSTVGQNEPDTRDVVRVQGVDGRYAIDTTSGSSERLFSELGDVSGGGGLDVTVPLTSVRLKAGSSYLHTSRQYQARRFHWFIFGEDARFQEPEEAFSDANVDQLSFYEATLPSDGYQTSRGIAAGYVLADISAWDPLRIVAGARVERSVLDLNISSTIDQGELPPLCEMTEDGQPSLDGSCDRTDTDLLPSINAVYALNDTTNLRAAYGITIARPNFREVAPSLYYDYVRRRAIGGNPNLLTTTVHNADVRWESFLGETELVAASVFYKRFVDPIERTLEDAGSGANVGFSNAAGADVYGLELEARASLARLAPALADFTLGANLAVIRSRIDLMGAERALQGQSPYVVNVDLGYARASTGTQVNVLYNAFGARIEEVGTGGAGDVYEAPFHRLDLTIGQKIRDDLKLKLGAANLLHQRVSRTQNGVEIYGYQTGTSVALSLELSVE